MCLGWSGLGASSGCSIEDVQRGMGGDHCLLKHIEFLLKISLILAILLILGKCYVITITIEMIAAMKCFIF